MSFLASYPGTCACCGEHFTAGESVAYTELGLVLLTHINRKEPELCTKCFVTKSVTGQCNCID